jgi:menaquinone-dependent protoporphyrinogen oxidase
MKVLVTAASKYGATAEIAQAIGDELQKRELDVTVAAVGDVTSIEDYDAVVAGSAVYAGHWLKVAREFVERNATALAVRPVWLFSSGPVGDPPKPEEDPVDVAALLEATTAQGHKVFPGKIDKKQLNFGEKAIVMALRAPEGDFRNWEEVRAWASRIGGDLHARSNRAIG